MLKYIVQDWDGNNEVFPCYRKAKAAWRKAKRMSYSVWIKPYRGNHANL